MFVLIQIITYNRTVVNKTTHLYSQEKLYTGGFMKENNFDVIVIGAGPWATVASLLAHDGNKWIRTAFIIFSFFLEI